MGAISKRRHHCLIALSMVYICSLGHIINSTLQFSLSLLHLLEIAKAAKCLLLLELLLELLLLLLLLLHVGHAAKLAAGHARVHHHTGLLLLHTHTRLLHAQARLLHAHAAHHGARLLHTAHGHAHLVEAWVHTHAASHGVHGVANHASRGWSVGHTSQRVETGEAVLRSTTVGGSAGSTSVGAGLGSGEIVEVEQGRTSAPSVISVRVGLGRARVRSRRWLGAHGRIRRRESLVGLHPQSHGLLLVLAAELTAELGTGTLLVEHGSRWSSSKGIGAHESSLLLRRRRRMLLHTRWERGELGRVGLHARESIKGRSSRSSRLLRCRTEGVERLLRCSWSRRSRRKRIKGSRNGCRCC